MNYEWKPKQKDWVFEAIYSIILIILLYFGICILFSIQDYQITTQIIEERR